MIVYLVTIPGKNLQIGINETNRRVALRKALKKAFLVRGIKSIKIGEKEFDDYRKAYIYLVRNNIWEDLVNEHKI